MLGRCGVNAAKSFVEEGRDDDSASARLMIQEDTITDVTRSMMNNRATMNPAQVGCIFEANGYSTCISDSNSFLDSCNSETRPNESVTKFVSILQFDISS